MCTTVYINHLYFFISISLCSKNYNIFYIFTSTSCSVWIIYRFMVYLRYSGNISQWNSAKYQYFNDKFNFKIPISIINVV